MKLLLQSFLLTLFTIMLTSVNVFSQTATIATDQPDYPPGSSIIITGSGFQPGETVTLQVHHYFANGDNDTSPAHQPWTVTADVNGKVNATWLVPSDEDELGATLLLTADGQSSGLHAEVTFTDSGAFSYTTTTGYPSSVSMIPGTSNNTSLSVDVNAPKNNPTTDVSLSFVSIGSPGITIGAGSGQINLTSPTLQFLTTSNNAGVTHSFQIAVAVGSSVAPGTYNLQATAVETAGSISDGSKWNFSIVVGSTVGSIASVSIGTQSTAAVYGTASTTNYTISSLRGNNGTVNGTYSVSGLPAGVSAGFSVESFTSAGSTSFPGTTLSLNIPASLGAGSYNFNVFLTDGSNQATTTGSLVINKADATVSVNGYTGTYDANPHGATGTATGVGGVNLSSGLNLGSTFTDVPGGTANWSFSGGTNYNNQSGTAAIVINKADATVTVNGYTGTYDAQPHGATGTATGVGGVNLSSGLNLGSTFTDVPGGTANWSFSGGTNYNNQSGTAAIVINKADATVTVNGYTGTYDAQPHGATGTATGVGGVNLSSGLNLGSTFTDVPGGTANWSFSGGTNYNNQSGTAAIVINKADAIVNVTGYTGTYDAQPHGATGTATGVGGVNLSSGLNLGSTFTDVPGGTANWSFSGGTNYNDQSGTAAIVINKADATVTVNGYTGTYDANPHGATGTATGVGGVNLSSGLNLGSTFTDVPGGTANWSFSGGTNYNNQSGTAAIVINKADAIVNVTGYSGTYDAQPHGATGTATGVGGVNLSSGLNLGSSFTDVPGGTANWSFSGGTNYNNQSGTAAIVINKADATVTVNGYTGTYDAQPHGATGTATGVGSVNLSSGLNLGSTFTDVPGGTANWTFNGGTNYNNQSGTAAIVINKADAIVNVTGYTGTYDAQPHGATGTATGVGGVNLSSGLNLGSSFTDVPGGTANWSFSGGTNYNNQSGTAAIVINKADQTITWNTPAAIVYGTLLDGTQLNATVAGVSGGSSTGALTYTPAAGTLLNASVSQTLHVDAAATNNYNAASKEVTIVVNKRPITITPDAGQSKYCGQIDPVFSYASSESLISGNSFSGSLGRTGDVNSGVGTYPFTIGTLSAGNNYTLSLGGSNTFEIKGVFIDASASSVAIQLNTSTTSLKATVTNALGNPVSGASVTFTVTNSTNDVLATGSSVTDTLGTATLSVNIAGMPIGLYKVVAVAGSGCTNSTAYMTIYDPNGNFITGGGWILSPLGSLVNDPAATGKANFGFNAKYKKGSNQVDGNTEFQFQQGNFNFKSSSLDAGTLVISGAKATYRGVGTVNGTGNYGFMVSAVDGQISGGGGFDLFRIKIWDRSNGNTVVYDNNIGKDENGVPTTALGGGSIVIHNANGKNSRESGSGAIGIGVETTGNRPDPTAGIAGEGPLSVKIMPNPTSYYFTVALQSLSKENVKLIITDISGKVLEQRINITANSTIQLGNHYRPGIYIAQFIQENDRVTVRLIKQGK